MNYFAIIIYITSSVAFSSAILPGIDRTDRFSNQNLLLLVKRKFESIPDQYFEDDFCKPDVEFLRSSNKKCVFDKLNLIDIDEVSEEELKKFDPIATFGDEQEDLNTLVIFVMYSCIEDFEAFNDHDFANSINKPRIIIPKNATECAKYELKKLNKEKPLIQNFSGLKNFTQKQCNRILGKIKSDSRSGDDLLRGCLKIYDNLSLEYGLKFAIMNHEMPNEEIYKQEKEKYGRESNIVNDDFVDCMLKGIL